MNQTVELIDITKQKKSCLCIKNQEQEIDEKDIWKGDLFDRKTVADDFTKIIETIEQPFVLSVDAPYGYGKTFFLKRWMRDLIADKKHVAVYFNAWNSDFTANPLVPFMYNVIEQLKEQGLFVNEEEYIKNRRALGKLIGDVIKAATFGGVDVEAIAKKANKNTIFNNKCLENYGNVLNNIEKFKNIIKEIVVKTESNIYIFVDELERCRPTFAIELLECIKHLFNIPKLVFILGIDRTQLKHSISNIYGDGMDGEGYLRRFIDLELRLPKFDVKVFSKLLASRFKIENSRQQDKGTWTQGFDELIRFFNIISPYYGLSLRDTEQCFTELNIISKIHDGKLLLVPLLALLVILRAKDYKFYEEIETHIYSRSTVKEFMQKIRGKNRDNPDYALLEKMLMATFVNINDMNHFVESLNGKSQTPQENDEYKLHILSVRLLTNIRENYLDDDINVLDYVKSKLFYISMDDNLY